MILKSKNLTLELADNGSIAAISANARCFTSNECCSLPLFNFRIRFSDGGCIESNTLDAGCVRIRRLSDSVTEICFDSFPAYDISFGVKLTNSGSGSFYITVDADNRGAGYLEYIEFSGVLLANEFVSDGGNLKLFWPMTEGCELDSPALREKSWKRYYPAEYPSHGWQGLYPGAVPMQFMACYDGESGLYFAPHDTSGMFKGIDFLPTENGVQLLFRMFCAIAPVSRASLGFPFVISKCGGDWMSAAEIYRDFIEESFTLPEPTEQDSSLPEWYSDFPLVVTYPVRGTKDIGDMTPNALFPYENVLPIIEKLKKRLGMRIMILLMHWEGTAPWAPPFIWPPFGGEEMFREFVRKLHAKGDLIGIYASGLAWTDSSTLVPTYDMNAYRLEHELDRIMCTPPGGGKAFTYICQGPIRYGTDMCAACETTKQLATDEIIKAANAGVDYLQYFDQTIGGEPAVCYSSEHSHPPVPGAWQTGEMKALCALLREKLGDSKLLIGCESAAAENFIGDMRFNDLRFNCIFEFAKAVPAYAFVFHKYIVNFMGNQNGFTVDVPSAANPDCCLFRLAYSFTAGDLLTLVIRDDGTIVWDWDCDWSISQPDQEHILTLIASMNVLRRGDAKKYLQYGEMIRPPHIESGDYTMHRANGADLTYPSVLSTAWQATDGSRAAVLVNYLPHEQTVALGFQYEKIISGSGCRVEGNKLHIPALTAVLIAF